MITKQTKPNKWSCLPTSFAMAVGDSIEDFIKEIGHDGSKIVNDLLGDPMCRQGFHIQECIWVVLNTYGYTVTPIEMYPTSIYDDGGTRVIHRVEGFNQMIQQERGILTGIGRKCHHAVAFDRGMIFDPDPGVDPYPYSLEAAKVRGFYGNTAWIVL